MGGSASLQFAVIPFNDFESRRERKEKERGGGRERERKREATSLFCVQEKNNLIGGVSFATHERWACFLGVTRCGRSTSLDRRRH